jgi:hypothetical protein
MGESFIAKVFKIKTTAEGARPHKLNSRGLAISAVVLILKTFAINDSPITFLGVHYDFPGRSRWFLDSEMRELAQTSQDNSKVISITDGKSSCRESWWERRSLRNCVLL